MKHILITGVNSYVGNNLNEWLQQYPDTYTIDRISLRYDDWKQQDFSLYDVVVHVAGIAHRKETKANAQLYYDVNRDLAYEIAEKAKKESIKQFIFLSSMSVYGLEEGTINNSTPLNPKNHYGKSKLEAESLIKRLGDRKFKVAILRPPMIYGRGCKGNYQRLAKLAKIVPVFPKINNKRSMIFIDNLSEFIRLLIEEQREGLFLPQNKEYICTSELVETIAQIHNKRIHMTKVFNPIIKRLKMSTVNKVFGNLIYDKKLADIEIRYNLKEFKDTVKATEKTRSNN